VPPVVPSDPILRICVQNTDVSAAITLRRELLETIQNKFPDYQTFDDLQWPLMTSSGSPLPRPKNRRNARLDNFLGPDDEYESNAEEKGLRQYWESVRTRYQSRVLDAPHLSMSSANELPANWTVVNISVTEDKSTLFVARQRAHTEPLVFCVPLKGRRESEEDEHLTFEDALGELRAIIEQSDMGTRQAVHVKGDDQQARAAWWAERSALDKRMQELLENIEFCWLGAFKVICIRLAGCLSWLTQLLDSSESTDENTPGCHCGPESAV
jgi:separase